MPLRTAGSTPRFRARTHHWWHRPDNIVITLTLMLTLAIATTFHLPAKVPPLRIINKGPLTVSLEVRPAGVPGWMDLGAFPPGRATVSEVIDQGDTWLVRARVGSHTAQPFSVSRDQIKDGGQWRLVIPEAVTESLRRDGAEPQP